ncbi:SDR family NAD(P)-dependent oxidoreductase [Paenibacillus sp. PsM32]|uniref:SDR family NAD(P)-dependent oxidoreductase n=1 Tax=Paenibacillus sp. PsM32 TaxID=3030536 RepID=UPI00263B0779|nr:SDR family NAD(P)-dependent oxidoreductase [Paenibacillus sp. PsM32]MDN4617508.1 SDR family NAD(P)-dependent oxidoreductase [Paenibacillus sp. PsM32]
MNTTSLARIACITGANHGIGLALTRRLLEQQWQVIAIIRSSFATDDIQIQQAIQDQRLRIYVADVSDFEQLRTALTQIQAQETHIDILYNNAGGSYPELSFSPQGRELHFDTQTVAPYIILKELERLIQQGTLRTVINTSSAVFATLLTFDPDQLEHPTKFKPLFGAYATAKLALSLWTFERASEFEHQKGIKLLSVDPGGNNTLRSGKRSGIPFFIKILTRLFFPAPTRGASLLYEAALGENHSLFVAGDYIVKGKSAPLKFKQIAPVISEKVHRIYEQEYKR